MIKRILLTVGVVALLGASLPTAVSAGPTKKEAWHSVSLTATPKMQKWQSDKSLPSNRELEFQVFLNGRKVDETGALKGNCIYLIVVRKLAVKLSNCGVSPVTIRYFGSTRFQFRWRLRSY